MSRHVHECKVRLALGQMREPEVDRDAAQLLFLQPIRISTRQRLHNRALAMVDVPGGADDDIPRHAVPPIVPLAGR